MEEAFQAVERALVVFCLPPTGEEEEREKKRTERKRERRERREWSEKGEKGKQRGERREEKRGRNERRGGRKRRDGKKDRRDLREGKREREMGEEKSKKKEREEKQLREWMAFLAACVAASFASKKRRKRLTPGAHAGATLAQQRIFSPCARAVLQGIRFEAPEENERGSGASP